MERRLTIAVGASRKASAWLNEEVTWDAFCDRMGEPVRTSETMEAYLSLAKHAQTDIKDVGGFVAGRLEKGERKARSVKSRSMVALDYDRFGDERREAVETVLRGKLWLLHSTHKSRPGARRARVVIPTDRDMTPDEYGAVSRRLAERIGMEGIDRTTFEPNRLMFWPSVAKDGEWLYAESREGAFVSVDDVLGSYRDWRDMSLWPVTADERGILTLSPSAAGGA